MCDWQSKTLDPDDLAPVDEFHHGGRVATAAFAPRLNLQPGMHLLGIGGPARYFARHQGCQVTGIDLTEEFVAVARMLTSRLGMDGQISFEQGSALPRRSQITGAILSVDF